MIRCLCAGESRAKRVAFSAASASSASDMVSTCPPRSTRSVASPTSLADFAADQFVVAGEDLDRDAVVLQRQDGGGRGFLGRIEEGDIALEDQFVFVVLRVGRPPLHVPVRNGQHAEAVGAEFVALFLQLGDHQRVDGIDLPLQLERLQRLNTASVAPLQIRRWIPSGVSTTTDISLREKSKGISSTFL